MIARNTLKALAIATPVLCFSTSANAQFGGLLNNVPGLPFGGAPAGAATPSGPGSAASNPTALLAAFENNVLQANAIEDRGNRLFFEAAKAVNMANGVLEGSGLVVERVGALVAGLARSEADMRSKTGTLTDQIERARNTQLRVATQLRQASVKAKDQASTSGSEIGAENLVGGHQAVSDAVAPIAADVANASQQLRSQGAKLQGAAANVKTAYFTKVILPVIGDMSYSVAFLEGMRGEINAINRQLDQVDRTAKAEQARLVADAAPVVASLVLQIAQLTQAASQIKSNPTQAITMLPKLTAAIQTAQRLDSIISKNQARIGAVNEQLGKVIAVMSKVGPNVNAAATAAKSVTEAVNAVVAAVVQ